MARMRKADYERAVGKKQKTPTKHNVSQSADVVLLVHEMRLRGFPPPEPEYPFAKNATPPRKWRFDLAWVDLKVAFEREGGTWGRSRHTSGKGYRNDCEKYNAAVAMGWVIIRGTVDMLRDGTVNDKLAAILEQRQGRVP